MKKLVVLLGIIFLISLMFVPLVSASVVTLSSVTGGNSGYTVLQGDHPSLDSDMSAIGNVFNATDTGYLYSIEFELRRNTGATGTLTAYLAGYSGAISDDSAVANATIFASSINTVDVSTFSTSSTSYYTFMFNQTYEIVENKLYAAYIVRTDGSGTVVAVTSGTTDSSVASLTTYHNGAWFPVESTHEYFHMHVYGDTTGTAPTSTPTPTPAGGDGGDADMEALTDAILPFLVPLLVCLIPALLGYKFVGELGFFIGLNVGCILAYVTLAATAYAFPLWGIILVGVMDVAVVLMRR